jgi:hypothetical protein
VVQSPNVSSILGQLLQSTGRVNIRGSARVTSVQTKSDNESKMIVTVNDEEELNATQSSSPWE